MLRCGVSASPGPAEPPGRSPDYARAMVRRFGIGLVWLAWAAGWATGTAAAGDDAFVRSREPIGPYLAVHLAGDSEHHLLLPPTEACVALARPEARVRYVDRGFPGRLEGTQDGEALRCEAAGILDLERIRDRRPRPRAVFDRRRTAFWETTHRDGKHALLRGRFPLAPVLGIAGGQDLVAVVADEARCADIVAGTDGALEYRDAGPALRLSAGDSRCPLLGLARPLPKAP